jgi:hypothetical protein
MARGQTTQANDVFGQASGVFGNSNQNAQNLYSQLLPQLQQEATDPQGFGKKGLAALNTANSQSVGGATSGAVGDIGLTAARTRNSGGVAAGEDEAVRSGERQLSQNAVGIQGENEQLKQAQQQAGLAGEGSLYGTNTKDALSALGLETSAVNAATQAGQSGWFQNMTGLMNGLKGAGYSSGGTTYSG